MLLTAERLIRSYGELAIGGRPAGRRPGRSHRRQDLGERDHMRRRRRQRQRTSMLLVVLARRGPKWVPRHIGDRLGV